MPVWSSALWALPLPLMKQAERKYSARTFTSLEGMNWGLWGWWETLCNSQTEKAKRDLWHTQKRNAADMQTALVDIRHLYSPGSSAPV